ncbi:AMP-binding protein [Microbaculum sp. FT89]|uniref:AMP-binding protein n=1 Tax=Microbaculum sp. FT89 TaxID=3447298 RepID=UPI003F52FEAE
MTLFADNLVLRIDDDAEGDRRCRSSLDLPSDLPDVFDRLEQWARSIPSRPLLTEPSRGGRKVLTYADALRAAEVVQARLANEHGLSAGCRLASLVPAGSDALALKLACLRAGIVHIALPPFPFREGKPNETGDYLLATGRPDMIVAPDDHPAISGIGAVPVSSLTVAMAEASGERSARVTTKSSDWAEIFFTSGSTGQPKGVPITRGMIASNQVAYSLLWPFLAAEPPVVLDWLPWHHVFGGLDNIYKVIWHGGTMHVDVPPSPATIRETVRLLGELGATLYIAVPRGLKDLMDCLEKDEAAAARAARRLRAIYFAGAGIDQGLWARLRAFCDGLGTVEILSGYGATEAASTICLCPGPLERPGELGHPLPGYTVRLVETDGRSELRIKGPNVAPGYLGPDGLRPLPCDERGFYRTGDAAVLHRRGDAQEVLLFDGRLSEDFKLSSGVKVRVGMLRAALLARCAPRADDVVIAGENADELVALVFPAAPHAADPDLIERIAHALGAWNAENPSGSTAIARFAIAASGADREAGEVSDKGQIVQSRYLRNHADTFARLLAGDGHAPAAARSPG